MYCDSSSQAENLCGKLFAAISIQHLKLLAYFIVYFPSTASFYKK